MRQSENLILAAAYLIVLSVLIAVCCGTVAMADSTDYCGRARLYGERVLSGEIPACQFVKQAAQRQADDLARVGEDGWRWRFDEDKGNRICAFLELLPHAKGTWATPTIQLEDWQCFMWATVFGWVDVDTGYRRYRRVYIEIPRKNSKSTQAAGVGLYLFAADGENGSEVYSAAITRDQAKIVWGQYAKRMLQLSPGLRKRFGIEVLAHHFEIGSSGAIFRPLSSEADSLEGLNIHGGIVDELHAHKTRKVHDVLDSAMGSRRQPLLVEITTAGSDSAGIGKEVHDYVADVLAGRHEDEQYYGVIYTIDAEDDWTTVESARKANPNYGVSVLEDELEALRRKALNVASAQSTYKTKHLDIWVSTADAYFNMLAYRACRREIALEQFEGVDCWFALDLASKKDIADLAILFRKDGEYTIFANHYLPEKAIEEGNENFDRYRGWQQADNFTLTSGNLIDHELIEDNLQELAQRFRPKEIGFDPWNATELGTRMLAEGLPMVEIPMTTRNLSEPMKTLDGLIDDKRLVHDGDPVLEWMFSNVTAKIDHNENVFPRKERASKKNDGAIATMMAMGRALAGQPERVSIYEQYVDGEAAVV